MQSLTVTIISVGRSGQEIGDYYLESVKEGLASGYFLPDDYGWYEGLSEWRPLPEIVKMLSVPPDPASVARTVNPSVIQGFRKSVDRIVAGKSNLAKERKNLHDLMDSIGIKPDDRTYFNDFIDPVLNTNVNLKYGFRSWKEGNEEGAIDAFPAQELVDFGSQEYAEWIEIWSAARNKLGSKTTAIDTMKTGRMVAMKNDPIWTAISKFDLPFPPFRFDSGMGVEDVSYEDAVALGVMAKSDNPLPPPKLVPDFERVLTRTLAEIDPNP